MQNYGHEYMRILNARKGKETFFFRGMNRKECWKEFFKIFMGKTGFVFHWTKELITKD